jgi:hypothetical protein
MTALIANQNPIFKNHVLILLPEPTPKVEHIMGPAGKIIIILTFVKVVTVIKGSWSN